VCSAAKAELGTNAVSVRRGRNVAEVDAAQPLDHVKLSKQFCHLVEMTGLTE
jgi:hypothetical protein